MKYPTRESFILSLVALCAAALLSVLLAGCTQDDGFVDASIFTMTEPFFTSGASPIEVGPTPRGLKGVDASDCVDCHADIVSEWLEDNHRLSYSNKYFQAGFALDHHDFCRHCHAPRALTGNEPAGVARDDGIDCAVCHIRGGKVIATRVTRAGQEAHAEQAFPMMAKSEYCAYCHQFRFPDVPLLPKVAFDPAMFMQKTFDEWRASTAYEQGIGCMECHMPLVPNSKGDGRHRSHRFLGLRDLDFVRSAIRVEVEAARRSSYVSVYIRIDPHGVGHAFPTGDVLRQLRLEVTPEGHPEATKSIVLGRRFEPMAVPDDRVVLRQEVVDSRIPPPGSPESTKRLPFVFMFSGLGQPATLSYSLEVLRCSDKMARFQGLSPRDTHLTIHSGTVVVP